MNQVLKAREVFAAYLTGKQWIASAQTHELSPSGRYALNVTEYEWREANRASTFSAVTISDTQNEQKLLEFKAEDQFRHGWVQRGENEYLLCAELRGAQTVIEFPTLKLETYFVSSDDFIWVEFYPAADANKVVVLGCHWACPYEFIAYDFSFPLSLLLPILARTVDGEVGEIGEDFGAWLNNDSFSLKAKDGTVRIIQISQRQA